LLEISEDGLKCKEVWRNEKFSVVQGHIVVLGKRIYGVSKKEMTCVDWKSGEKIFSNSVKSSTITLISSDNLIYSYSDKGEVKLLEPNENGLVELSSFKVKGGSNNHCAHPVIKDGRLYIRHDNSLFVYDIAAKK